MVEEYKDVLGFEGLYQISNFGNVKSLINNIILHQYMHYKGHMKVSLYNKGKVKRFFVHRLVAIAFIPQIDREKDVVNHKDEVKHNNCVLNLEWTTGAENTHYYFNGQKIKRDLEAEKGF